MTHHSGTFLARQCGDYVVEHLAADDAVLVIDETGFLKQGRSSCGVGRQYTGSAGKITNCQIGVFAAYVSRHGHAFIDRALYLPKTWTDDPVRMAAAHVPDDTTFATKPALAVGLSGFARRRSSRQGECFSVVSKPVTHRRELAHVVRWRVSREAVSRSRARARPSRRILPVERRQRVAPRSRQSGELPRNGYLGTALRAHAAEVFRPGAGDGHRVHRR
jgi:hypothetical protein